MNAKTKAEIQQENPAPPRLVTEATLLEMLFPAPPSGIEIGDDHRPKHWPKRRTMLSWRDSGLLPHVKIGRSKKARVYYLLNDCIAAIQAMTRRGKRAKK